MVRGEGLRRYLAVNAAALLGLHDRVVDPLGKGGRVSDTSLENVLAREKELLLRLAKLIVELAGGLEVACRGCEVGGVTVFVVGMPGRLGKSNYKNISIRGEGEHSGYYSRLPVSFNEPGARFLERLDGGLVIATSLIYRRQRAERGANLPRERRVVFDVTTALEPLCFGEQHLDAVQYPDQLTGIDCCQVRDRLGIIAQLRRTAAALGRAWHVYVERGQQLVDGQAEVYFRVLALAEFGQLVAIDGGGFLERSSRLLI